MSKQPANQPGSSPLPLLAVGFFIGGLITSTIVTLEIVPAIYSLWRGRQVEWVKGPKTSAQEVGGFAHAIYGVGEAGAQGVLPVSSRVKILSG